MKPEGNSQAVKGNIFSIQKFSIHDGPGIRTTVFLKGCPLSCQWCANPESQKLQAQYLYDKDLCIGCGRCISRCPAQALHADASGRFVVKDHSSCSGCSQCVYSCPKAAWSKKGESRSVQDVVEECLKDKDFYEQSGGGVTFSGGEAMFQPEFVKAAADKLHTHSIPVAMETTGAVDEEVFFDVASHLDLVLYDVKHWNSVKHRQKTGIGNEQILSNLQKLAKTDKEFLCRIPVIPGFNDTKEDAEKFAALFQDLSIGRVQLLPFHQMGEKKYEMLEREYACQNLKPLHPEDLQEYAAVFAENGVDAFF